MFSSVTHLVSLHPLAGTRFSIVLFLKILFSILKIEQKLLNLTFADRRICLRIFSSFSFSIERR